MKNLSYFQPDLNLLYKELNNCSSILDEELRDLSSEDKGLVDASFSIQREFLSLEKAMNKSVTINNIEQTIEQILTILEFSNG